MNTYYNFLEDRRDDADIVDLVRTDKLPAEDEVIEYLKRYSNNAWYYYRYMADLEPYAYLFDAGITINDSGFLCDDFGNLLSPLSGYVDEHKHRLQSFEHEESLLNSKAVELERKRNFLKRQEERLDDDIYKYAENKVAFLNKNNLISLTPTLLDNIGDLTDESLGKILRKRIYLERDISSNLQEFYNESENFIDDDFNLF